MLTSKWFLIIAYASMYMTFSYTMENKHNGSVKEGLRLLSGYVREAQAHHDHNKEQLMRDMLYVIRMYGIEEGCIERYVQAACDAHLTGILVLIKDLHISPNEAHDIVESGNIIEATERLLGTQFEIAVSVFLKELQLLAKENRELVHDLENMPLGSLNASPREAIFFIKAVEKKDWQALIDKYAKEI